jgi:hypothetical protein
MAAARLHVELTRDDRYLGSIRTYGGNKSSVRSLFGKYARMNNDEIKAAFPNAKLQGCDIVKITCRYGMLVKFIK